jgi:imidazolonepropionase-like amidohydrolase
LIRKNSWGVAAFFLLLFGASSFRGQTAPEKKIIALRCGSLFDGRGDSLRRDMVIVVKDGQIENVVPEIHGGEILDLPSHAPSDVEVIDLSRETCLPGLIDTHTHILLQGDITAADYDEQLLKQSPEYRTILATVNARRALEYGFTSIRDVET